MDFDQLYVSWLKARDAANGSVRDDCVRSARRLSSSVGVGRWTWFDSSLQDESRKWFVAAIFDAQPVPKKLFDRMLHTGVLEKDPSRNRWFIEPCLNSFGAASVLVKLLAYLQSGSEEEKAGAASALYWVPRRSDPDPDADLRQQILCQMLHEFVTSESLYVRRRIIPMLVLEESKYPENFRSFVRKAIKIARDHSDEYIRHRVEIQLGSGGPYMAIPNSYSGEQSD